MQWLADACVDARLVRALREAGCDVRELSPQEASFPDEKVLELAWRERCILLTDDKDFGQWVVRSGRPVQGLVLVRIDPTLIGLKISRVVDLFERWGSALQRKLVVVGADRYRFRPLPGSQSRLE